MKKMTKRTLALAMSAGMLLSNSVWAADADPDPYGAMPETVTLHVGRSEDANASYLSGQDSLNNYLVDYIKEQLNVDFVYDGNCIWKYSRYYVCNSITAERTRCSRCSRGHDRGI